MTDESPTIGTLGGYTNNQMNKEGIKKLLNKIDAVSDEVTDVTTELTTKQDKLTAGTGIEISDENVISALGGFGFTEVTLPEGTTLKNYVENNASTKDFILVTPSPRRGWFYIPNGWDAGGIDIRVSPHKGFAIIDTSNATYSSSFKFRELEFIYVEQTINKSDMFLRDLITGDTIDENTIDNYISVDGTNYSCIKPFSIRVATGSSYEYGIGIIVPGQGNTTYINSGVEHPDYNGGSVSKISLNSIYACVKNNTSFTKKASGYMGIYADINYTATMTLYERNKLI